MAKSKSTLNPLVVGKNVFISTVTKYYTGHVEEVLPDGDMILSHAAWIADTGRFANSMKSGDFSEVEPYPDDMIVRICMGSIVDAVCWPHPLPRVQK